MTDNEEKKTGLFGIHIPDPNDPKVQEIIKRLLEPKKEEQETGGVMDGLVIGDNKSVKLYDFNSKKQRKRRERPCYISK